MKSIDHCDDQKREKFSNNTIGFSAGALYFKGKLESWKVKERVLKLKTYAACRSVRSTSNTSREEETLIRIFARCHVFARSEPLFVCSRLFFTYSIPDHQPWTFIELFS